MKSFLFTVVAYLQCTFFVSAALYLNEEDVAQALERGKEHAAVCRVGDVSVFFDNFIDDEEDIVIAYDGEITGVLIHPKAVLTSAFYLKHNQIKSPLSVYFEDASGNRRRVGVKACHIHPLFSFFASKKKDFYINELVADFAILELEETLDERTFPPARLARNYAPLEAESHLYGVGYGDFASIEEGRAYSQHEQRRCFDMMTGNQCVEFFHAAMHFVTWEMLEDPKNRHRQIGLPLWGDSGAPIFNEAGEVVWMGSYAVSFVDMMDEIENDKKESDVHDQDVVGFFTDIQVGLPWVDAVLAEINGLAAHQNIHSPFSIVEFVDNATLEYCVTLAFGEGDFGCAMGLLDMGVALSPSSLRGDWTAEALKNACKQNNLEVIYRLHALGVDIDASPDGFSPLSTALFDGHYDAAAVLIELGADLDTRPWWLPSRGEEKSQYLPLLDLLVNKEKEAAIKFLANLLGPDINNHISGKFIIRTELLKGNLAAAKQYARMGIGAGAFEPLNNSLYRTFQKMCDPFSFHSDETLDYLANEGDFLLWLGADLYGRTEKGRLLMEQSIVNMDFYVGGRFPYALAYFAAKGFGLNTLDSRGDPMWMLAYRAMTDIRSFGEPNRVYSKETVIGLLEKFGANTALLDHEGRSWEDIVLAPVEEGTLREHVRTHYW